MILYKLLERISVHTAKKKEKKRKKFASRIRRSQRKKKNEFEKFSLQRKRWRKKAQNVKSDVVMLGDFCMFLYSIGKSTKVVYSLYRGYFNT